jgi:hypothetical protein
MINQMGPLPEGGVHFIRHVIGNGKSAKGDNHVDAASVPIKAQALLLRKSVVPGKRTCTK